MGADGTRRGRIGMVVALAAAFLLGGAAFSAVEVAGATGSVTPEAVCTGYPHLAVDWQGCDLRAANLNGQFLNDANLSTANLSNASLGGTAMKNANLAGANLTKAFLYDVNLSGDNLSGALLAGANFGEVFSGGIKGVPATLPVNWVLKYGFLIGPSAEMGGANLTGDDLTGVNLTQVILTGANLSGTDLGYATGLTAGALGGVTWNNTICPDGTNSNNDLDTCVNNLTPE